MPKARGIGRVLGWVWKPLALGTVFTAAAGVGTVLHANTPPGRVLGARVLETLASAEIQGSLEVGTIVRVEREELVARNVVVRDAAGNRVLDANHLRIFADIPEVVWKIAFGTGKVSVVFDHVRAEQIDCHLIPDPKTGEPSFVTALSAVPTPTATPEAEARHLRVWLPAIEIGNGFVRGTLGDLPQLQANLKGVKGQMLISPKGLAIDVERFATIAGIGGAEARGTGTLTARAPGRVWGHFDGHFGDVQVHIFAQLHNQEVSGRLDVPGAAPEAIRALWADWPLQDHISANVEANGKLPTLAMRGDFGVGNARLKASGNVTVEGDVGAILDVDAENIDLRALWPDAPETNADIQTRLELWEDGDQIAAGVNGRIAPTIIEGYEIPRTDVRGVIIDGGFDGKVNLHEPGMPVRALVTVHPDGDIDIDADARTFRIEDAPRLEGVARGTASLSAQARIERRRLDVTLNAKVNGFSMEGMQLGSGQLSARAAGPMKSPEAMSVSASLAGSRLGAGAFDFETVRATAIGTLGAPRVRARLKAEQGPTVEASALVASGVTQRRKNTVLRDLEVAILNQGARIEGQVRRLDLGDGEIDVDDLALVSGDGNLDGSIALSPDRLEVDIEGSSLDLAEASKVLGLGDDINGILTLRAKGSVSPDEVRGQLHVGVANAKYGSLIEGVSVALTGDFDARGFVGSASGIVQGLGSFGSAWEARLDGTPLEFDSWKNATGEATVFVSDVDLEGVADKVEANSEEGRVRGKLFGNVRLSRAAKDLIPSALFVMETNGLDFETPDFRIQGIDIQGGGSLRGSSGESTGTTRFVHQGKVLSAVTGSLDLDLDRFLKDPAKLGEQLLETPIEAVVTVEGRPFSELPELIRPDGVEGVIERAMVRVSGLPRAPELNGNIALRGVRLSETEADLAVDVNALPYYRPETGEVGGNAGVYFEGRQIARATVRGRVPYTLEGATDDPWSTSSRIDFLGTPLRVIPGVAEEKIDGFLEGSATIRRVNEKPILNADIEARQVTINRLPVGDGSVVAQTHSGLLNTWARLSRGNGRLDAIAKLGLRWDEVLPGIDESKPIDVDLRASSLDAVVLKPAFGDALSQLTGGLDGQIGVSLRSRPTPENPEETYWSGEARGNLRMTDGTVQVAALGLEMRDTQFSATIRPSGGLTIIETKDIQAKARSKTVNLSAQATLVFDGLRLVRGGAGIGMREVPLLTEGVSMGRASGTATLKLERLYAPDMLLLTVRVPEGAEVRLPRSETRDVISLEDNPDIRVFQYEIDEEGEEDVPWRVVLDLQGLDLRQGDMVIPIRGQPVIEVGKKTDVVGFVELLQGGRMPTLGEVFVIDNGLVRFDTGDPTNPHLQVTATWRAPNGTQVYVDVFGTLNDARLSLRSVPPLSETEILALLLGGGTTGSDDSSTAGNVASGVVLSQVLGLDELLADTPWEFRTQSTETGDQSVTTAYRKDNVTVEGTYTSTNEGADFGRRQDPFTLTTSIQFGRNWSLRYQIGYYVSQQLDLLWQYRY